MEENRILLCLNLGKNDNNLQQSSLMVFLKKKIISDLQKSCKTQKKISHLPFTQILQMLLFYLVCFSLFWHTHCCLRNRLRVGSPGWRTVVWKHLSCLSPWPKEENRFGSIKKELYETPQGGGLLGKVVSSLSLEMFKERLPHLLLRNSHGTGGGLGDLGGVRTA